MVEVAVQEEHFQMAKVVLAGHCSTAEEAVEGRDSMGEGVLEAHCSRAGQVQEARSSWAAVELRVEAEAVVVVVWCLKAFYPQVEEWAVSSRSLEEAWVVLEPWMWMLCVGHWPQDLQAK